LGWGRRPAVGSELFGKAWRRRERGGRIITIFNFAESELVLEV